MVDSLKDNERSIVVRRLTMAELAEILDSVGKPSGKEGVSRFDLLESKGPLTTRTREHFSKTAALGATEKILALVAQYPECGTKKLADSLVLQGVSLSRQAIHTILVKHNLNRASMRKTWSKNQKEPKP